MFRRESLAAGDDQDLIYRGESMHLFLELFVTYSYLPSLTMAILNYRPSTQSSRCMAFVKSASMHV